MQFSGGTALAYASIPKALTHALLSKEAEASASVGGLFKSSPCCTITAWSKG